MKYSVTRLLPLNFMEMSIAEEVLFNSIPEIKANTLGVVRRKGFINNFSELAFFLVLPSSSPWVEEK